MKPIEQHRKQDEKMMMMEQIQEPELDVEMMIVRPHQKKVHEDEKMRSSRRGSNRVRER